MPRTSDLNLQDQIVIDNSTQRTVSVIGGKGTGKTTLLKMLMKHESPVLAYDPLSVVKSDALPAMRVKLTVRDIDEKRMMLLMKATNKTLKTNNVIFSFDNMIQEEEIAIANMTLPLLSLRDGFIYFDEIHEFVPLHSSSIEVERYIRHCRNKNVGVVMTSQRPASVNKNVLALTDYLILFRVTWTHDIQAVKDLLKDVIPKDEVNSITAALPRLDFMEGFVIDYRAKEKTQQ